NGGTRYRHLQLAKTSNSMKGPASRWRSPPAFLVKVGEGVDEGEAVGAAGWVVAADRAVAAAAAAALSPHGRRGEVDPRSAIPAREPSGGPARQPRRAAQRPHQRSMAGMLPVERGTT